MGAVEAEKSGASAGMVEWRKWRRHELAGRLGRLAAPAGPVPSGDDGDPKVEVPIPLICL